MLQTKFTLPSIYNPGNQTSEEIISNFVVRLPEFDELFGAIKNDKMEKPPQHYLIQGQRGYGKTTLLLRLNIEIKRDKELNCWLYPIMFNEEQYGMLTLAKLWEEVIDILENDYEEFSGLSDQIDKLYDKISPEEEIFKLLNNELKRKNKKLVILLDNFGDRIQNFNKKENQRLREVLITCSYIRFIGASSVVLEFYYDYKQSFYDFFKVITLDELNKDETISLLQKLGETYKSEEIKKIINEQPARIEALRRLTAGVPRTIVMLFQIFVDDETGSSFNTLEALLDKVTPLYKHRLDNLSAQQQAIIDAIAQNWDAISTKEISKITRIASKAVSSQLNQLEKSQLVKKISTSTKNKLYQINERFFNIYYLMRLGKRRNRNRVIWLVKFLEIWCEEKELIARTKRHIDSIKSKKMDDGYTYIISQSLAKTHIPPELQHKLIIETRKYLTYKHSKYCRYLEKSHFEVLDEVLEDVKKNNIESAKRKLRKDDFEQDVVGYIIGEIYRDEIKDYKSAIPFYLESVKQGLTAAMNNIALLYENELKDYGNAEKYYLMAVEKGDSNAMFNLALMYTNELKDYDKAEKYYLLAIDKDYVDAMYNLALLYENKFDDYARAEKYYLMAIDKDYVDAMYNLALLYEEKFKNYNNAEKYYLMAIEKQDSDAMNNLALMYTLKLKNYKKAEKYYLMAIEKGEVSAMYNLALIYEEHFKDYKKVEKYYLMAIEKGDVSSMFNLALIYEEHFKDYKKAQTYYIMASENGDSNALDNLATLYLNEFKDYKKAEKYYRMAVKNGVVNAMNNLSNLYFDLHKNQIEALNLQEQAYTRSKDEKVAFGYIVLLLWNKKIETAMSIYKEYFDKEDLQKDVNENIFNILIHFIASGQINFVFRLFKENKYNFKDKYKPIYFAVLSLMGDEYKDELSRMGSELKETVDEIIAQTNELARNYYS